MLGEWILLKNSARCPALLRGGHERPMLALTIRWRCAVGGRTVTLAARVLTLSAGCATLLSAQEVRGVARAGATGDRTPPPLAETSVVLVDANGDVVAGALTDADGRFALRAPADGRYRVRARRIGFTPDSSALVSLRAGTFVTFDPMLHAFATRLASVRVDEAARCRIAPDAGSLAHQLWNEAQSALAATVVTGESHAMGFVLRRSERELGPDGVTVRASRSWDTRTLSSEPYASIAADSLAVHGFVVPVGQSLVYYAPDARTLLADAFARGHCFRPTTRADHPSEIGLGFAPAATASATTARRDVSGVLWLDRATGRLRDLEFTYGAEVPSGRTSPAATGRVHYQRLASGAWIVDHWVIRMPVVTTRTVMAPRAVDVVGAGTELTPEAVSTVTAVWEGGGDVVGAFAAGDDSAGALAMVGSVRGRFVDTVQTPTRGRRIGGVSGIRVELARHAPPMSGMTYATTTDSTGAFAFDSIEPGSYTLHVSGGAIDTLDVDVPAREIAVSAATSQSLLTVLPSAEAVVRRLCPEGLDRNDAVVRGSIRDATGRPAARARVTVAWFDVADSRQEHFVANAQTRATLTGADGAYVVCGVPRAHALTVTAAAGTIRSVPVTLEPSAAVVRLATIALPMAATTGHVATAPTGLGDRITGMVIDTLGHPVPGAMVRIDSTAWRPVRGSGDFDLLALAAGRHVLEARALGFAPHAWFVTVHRERATVAQLTLRRVTVLNGVEVTAAVDTTPLPPAGFSARRATNSGGSFLDEAEIARRGAVHVTDLLRSLPGVTLAPVTGALGNTEYVLVMRGVSTARAEVCPIQYYIDGHLAPSSENVDRIVSPKDLAAIEVYPGASQVPPQFKGPYSRCGVVALWTRGS